MTSPTVAGDRYRREVSSALDETRRAAHLLEAQDNAAALFAAVEQRAIIAPGITESAASDAVRDLAAELFGVTRHWHKRIVRSGPNTLQPYRENPPDRLITDDDIVFCDFGPIFEEWEADFGRTYVLGDDPVKKRLRDDLATVFGAGKAHFAGSPDITGAELFAHVVDLAERAGWEFGGPHAGHLVGEFPHQTLDPNRTHNMIMPGSNKPMRRLDQAGRQPHWILEIHLVDRGREIGGFYEELLTL
jgi:Xaa-Pro aminopeptidase